MSGVYVFGAAVDTFIAGVYEYDTAYVAAGDEDVARKMVEAIDPWADVSTSVEFAPLGTAEELAERDETAREILRERYKDESEGDA